MDTAALKASWGKVAAAGDDVPLYFYSHLFLSHPEVRSMFPIQMTAQREKLVAALGAVVSNVESLDDVVPVLEQLGRDHRRFAVVSEHYSAVGASLLEVVLSDIARRGGITSFVAAPAHRSVAPPEPGRPRTPSTTSTRGSST